MAKRMGDDELKAIVDAEISDALGERGSELTSQRQRAMEYYLGEPFGNEVEGRSQVVITEVADTIEWILPSLLKVFAGSDEVVRFDPEGPDDKDAAALETEAVNHVFYKDNPGFLILYTWFKDALLSKNGYVKVYWDESEKVTREEYSGLSALELAQLVQDPELEPTEASESSSLDEQGQPVSIWDVVFKRTRLIGKACIDPMPPEEVLVSRKARSIYPNECPFFAHRTQMTASRLREMGVSQKIIDDLPKDDGEAEFSAERLARFHLDDESSGAGSLDPAMYEYWVTECYLRVDYDGDGIAELRKVTRAGNVVLFNEPIDRVPAAALTPVILTHKHTGLSVADLVMDLQLLKSTVTRLIFDNFYATNNQRYVVGPGVNLDDLLTSRPGGLIRSENVGNVVPLVSSPLGAQAYDMLGYLDQIKESRTGVSRNLQGLNQGISGDTAHGVERLMSAAEQKIELIARIFAETGVKDLFLQIHELLRKHGKQRVVEIAGSWEQFDPTEWRDRNDMSIKVGLGTGDRSRIQSALGQILAFQEKVVGAGGKDVLVSDKNIYTALTDFARYSGLTSALPYFTDPDSPEVQQRMAQKAQEGPPPNPLAEAEQIKGQFKFQSDQMQQQFKAQVEQLKQANEHQKAMMELQAKFATDAAERASKEAIEAMKAELQAFLAGAAVDVGKPGLGAGLQEGV